MSLKYVNEGWQNEKLRSKCVQNKERKKVDIYLENTSLILIINNFIGLYVYIESLKINIMHTYIQGYKVFHNPCPVSICIIYEQIGQEIWENPYMQASTKRPI